MASVSLLCNEAVELLKKDTLEMIIKNEQKLKKMLSSSTLKFLAELKKHNNKNWFEANETIRKRTNRDKIFCR